jgi:hypothetical protein
LGCRIHDEDYSKDCKKCIHKIEEIANQLQGREMDGQSYQVIRGFNNYTNLKVSGSLGFPKSEYFHCGPSESL